MTTDQERLQAHLNLMHGEPLLRLTGVRAIEQASRLRARGFSYGSVALIMGVYHGEWFTSQRWMLACRQHGPERGVVRGGARVMGETRS